MTKIDETVHSTAPIARVFAFLSDFTSTEQWDPGTVRTVRLHGDGGVGTAYRNTSRFLGRTTELDYVVEEHEPPTRIVLRGENETVRSLDTMTLTPTESGGTTVRYEADFRLKGAARLVAPLLAPAFARLGRKGAAQMRTVLDRLAR